MFLFGILLFLFAAALDLVKRFFVCIFAAGILLLVTPSRKLRINCSVALLFILGISTLIFNTSSHGTVLDMIKPFAYVLAYVIGISLFQKQDNQPIVLAREETKVSKVIYVLAGGSALHFVLNMWINAGSIRRDEVVDFWTRNVMAATGQAALACLAVGVCIAFLFSKAGKWKKTIGISGISLIVIYNLTLAGRTLFVFIAIEIVAALLYLKFVEKRKMGKVLLIVLVVAILLAVLYNTNTFGMKSAFEESNFYLRFFGGEYSQDLEDDSRMEYKLGYLKLLLDYPWGGGKINDAFGHHAHDLYLDTYDQSGCFAFLAVCIYMIASVVRCAKCALNKQFSLPMRMLVFCTYLICNVQFWTEPIPNGMPWLFASYCCMDGAVSYLLYRQKEMAYTGYRGPMLESIDTPEI